MKVAVVGWISVSRIHRAGARKVDAAHAYPPYIFSENKFTVGLYRAPRLQICRASSTALPM